MKKLKNAAEVEAFKARFDAANQCLRTRCCDLEKNEERIAKLSRTCDGGRDCVDIDNPEAVLKLTTAEKQRALAMERQLDLEAKVGKPMQDLRNVLNDFQDVYHRACKPYYQEVEDEVTTLLLPFCENEVHARQVARQTGLVKACGHRINKPYGTCSDPRVEAQEAEQRLSALLAGENPFADIRARFETQHTKAA